MRRLAAVLILVLALFAPPARAFDPGPAALGADRSLTAPDFRGHIAYLASEELGGRAGGTSGGIAAGDYIASCFSLMGLDPGAGGSYFQPFVSGGERFRNVVAVVPGRDPAGEVVVVGAHYDHLGDGSFGGALDGFFGGGGEIHNGADDNASGTAGLLEIAEAFSLLPATARPQRTVVLVAFDGEERGLYGSTYYASHPLFPLDRTVTMVNMDMIGRARRGEAGPRLMVFGTATGEGLEGLVRQASDDLGLDVSFPGGVAPNSDHFPFYLASVPVLFPFTGLHGDYHRATDDVERIDADAGARVARLVFRTVLLLANAPARPVFHETSVDSGFDLESIRAMLGIDEDAPLESVLQRFQEMMGGGGGGRPRLGVQIGNADGGVAITGVMRGSPAEAAGLRAGDVVVAVDGAPIRSPGELRRAIHDAGTHIVLEVRRGGETLTIEAELPE